MKKRLLKVVVLIMLMFSIISTVNVNRNIKVNADETYLTSLEQLEGKKIGILTGTILDQVAEDNVKNCKINYYSSYSDIVEAMNRKVIDAFFTDEPIANYICTAHPSLGIVNKIDEEDYATIFKKNDEKSNILCNEYNEFLKTSSENGFLKHLEDVWIFGNEEDKVYDVSSSSSGGSRGTITYGTCTDVGEPFCYYKNNKIVGFEIELACEFAKAYNYNLKIKDFSFSSVLNSVSSGVADFAGGCITITEERKESILFSNPIYNGGIVVVMLTNDTEKIEENFFVRIKQSFYKTFIKDSRYKLFLNGILNTMIITISSLILGTILGFVFFLLCRKGNRIANTITNICFGFVHRLPAVVLLMILYYIILGGFITSGVIVSTICFTLTFASSIYKIVRNGVLAIDKGQYEASYALGFSNLGAFFKVVLPQAARHFMPLLKSEVITHIKATAIVGYIAVADLTRMSDVVRSRTFEAFFPLLVTALIYFILEEVLILIVKNIEFGIDTRKRKPENILKGIKQL